VLIKEDNDKHTFQPFFVGTIHSRTGSSGFDRGSASFGSIFTINNDPRNLFLSYSGAQDVHWSHSSIGLAISRDGFKFWKVSGNHVLEGTEDSFCCGEAMTPVVTEVGNRFYMIFSGRPSLKASRRIGIAYAEGAKDP